MFAGASSQYAHPNRASAPVLTMRSMISRAEGDAVHLHLFGPVDRPQVGPGYRYISGFLACLGDARSVSGRDANSGEVLDERRTGSWLGAVGYLILLDQLGKCFRPAGRGGTTESNAIELALLNWATEVDEADRRVIYALRNALAHDYSLFNRRESSSPYDFFFTLNRDPENLVVRAERPWNRDYMNHDLRATTVVSLRALGDLVELIVSRIRDAALENRIEIALPGGPDELTNRYGLFIPNEDPTNEVDHTFFGGFSGFGGSVSYLPPDDDLWVTGGIPPAD